MDSDVNPFNGAISGFTKSLGREYPNADVITLDVNGETGLNGALEALLLEISMKDHPLEVGRDGDRRYLSAMRIIEPSPEDNLELKDGMTLLVTGGGGGITAEILKEMAKMARLGFHIVDITELLPDSEELSGLNEDELSQKKNEIRSRLEKEGRKVTPVVLEREFSKITRSIGVYRLIKHLEGLGSEVHYHSADVRDAKALSKVTSPKNVRIDGVIHAAGIEQSKLLLNKTQEDFDRVYDVKIMGAKAVLNATKDQPLQFFMGFTSVAGRFGNAGQVDYSAANDTLAKMGGALRKYHPDCMVKAVGWSAWADIGMASKGSVKTILEVGGVTFIPPEDGIRYAIGEILHGREREVYYFGSLGPMDSDGIIKWEEGIHPALKGEKELPMPLVDSYEITGGDEIVASRTLDGKRERFLPDHTIMGTMVLPGVMGIELFSETAKLLLPESRFVGLENVRFRKPVNVRDPITIRVEGKKQDKKDGETRV